MFKVGQQVLVSNARVQNGLAVVTAYADVDKENPPKRLKSMDWNGHPGGPVVSVMFPDGKKVNFSNGDLAKVQSLEGKSKDELRALGLGTTVSVGGVTLRGKDGTEVWAEAGQIHVQGGTGVLEMVRGPYNERRKGADEEDEG